MKKHITIPEPCHENWNEMTPEEQGRHCAVCDKVVMDFTHKSKEEIIDKIESSEEQVCGRFNMTHVSPTKAQMEFYHKYKHRYKNIAASILAIGGTMAANEAVAQGDVYIKGDVDVNVQEQVQTNINPVILKGEVKHFRESGGAAGVRIVVLSGGKHIARAISDKDGKYRMTLPEGKVMNNQIRVEATMENFDPKILDHVAITKEEMSLQIVLNNDIMLLGEPAIEPVEIQEVPKECVVGKVKIDHKKEIEEKKEKK